jgi:SAM-dependent methyltransferase
MIKRSLRRCPICSAAQAEVLHRQQFVLPEGHPLAAGYDVVSCTQCGFGYADTPVGQAEYDAFYRQCSKYQDDKTSTGGGDSPWDARRLGETAETIAEHVPNRTARVLDVGCANGGLLQALLSRGFRDLTGLDPSLVCVANTRRRPGLHAVAGSLTELSADFGPFDCIVLSHVLEHVQDLHGAIEAVRGLLADGGCVYLEVPDANRYAYFLAAPFQDFNTEHINHFSLTDLANLARRAGLHLEQHGTKTIDCSHPVPYPALYGFFRPIAERAVAPVRQTQSRARLLEYIRLSRRMMRAIDARLGDALESSPDVIVWGTGQLALKLLAETSLGRARIAAFVDGNPINHGRLLQGQRIVAPEAVRELPYPIVITSILHESEIVQVIRDRLGLTNPLVTLADLTLAAEPV